MFGKKVKNMFGKLGKKAVDVGNMGKNFSGKVRSITTPLKKGLNSAIDSGLIDAVGVLPGGGLAAAAIRGAARGLNAVDRAARAGERIGGRVTEYGNAARSGQYKALGDLANQDRQKTHTEIERKENKRALDELPGFDDSMFH